MRNAPEAAAVSARDRYLISTCLALTVGLSWAYLARLAHHPSQDYVRMMAAMGMAIDRPWTALDGFFTFAMWAVMMVGMMTGSAAPLMLLYAGAQARRTARRVPLTVLLFGAGYLSVWMGFSAIAAFAQWGLQRAALLTETMTASRPALAAAILILAGVYQLTPVKGACLTQCRSPVGFLMTNWRDGAGGAIRMGTRHGFLCLGCCWALMIVLFAVGVMNLAWMAALTGLVLMEKLSPAGVFFSRTSGIAMIGWGVYILVQGLGLTA